MQYRAYAGNGKPFLYAAFAQQDNAEAQSILKSMAGHGYSIWPSARFDRRRIDKAALAILFLTPEAAADEAVNQTINYAVQKDKAVLVVHLAQTQLSPAQKLMLNTLQGILRYECASEDAFYEKLFGSALLRDLEVTPAQKNASRRLTWLLGAGAVVAAAAAVLLTLRLNQTVPEDSLAAQLGYSGKMKDITSILLYGERIGTTRSEKSFTGRECDWENELWNDTILYDDAGEVANLGDISDISDFAQLNNLTELSIAGNQVSDISPLFELNKLEYLDIAGNPVDDLSGIESLRSLHTLCIANTRVQNLASLDGCENLKTVYVDQDQYAAFANDGEPRAYLLVEVGPKEDLRWLSVHIFGGVEETGSPDSTYAVYVQTKSWNDYEEYEYAVYKNGKQVRISGRERERIFGDGEERKLHLHLNQSDFGPYDPASEYMFVVSYKEWSATYQIWHKFDSANQSGSSCQLVDTNTY